MDWEFYKDGKEILKKAQEFEKKYDDILSYDDYAHIEEAGIALAEFLDCMCVGLERMHEEACEADTERDAYERQNKLSGEQLGIDTKRHCAFVMYTKGG